METIIIYGSKYGNAKKYAMELSNTIKSEIIHYKDVKSLFIYDRIIYVGSLYAGSILGLSKTLNLIPKNSTKNIIIATVGLADPFDQNNISHIKATLKKQVPEDIYEKSKIFHLRGGIDYSKLNFIHKVMMKFMYNKIKKMPTEKQNTETKAILETYNQKIDFIDLNSLQKITEILL